MHEAEQAAERARAAQLRDAVALRESEHPSETRSAVPQGEWLERLMDAERINRFAQLISAQSDLRRVIDEAVHRTRELCDADHAHLLRSEEEGSGVFDYLRRLEEEAAAK